MIAPSMATWLSDAALQRRRMMTILLGTLSIVGLSAVDRRAIFMPWAAGEHPLVDTTPSAFFTAPFPGIGTSERVTPSFVTAAVPRSRFVPPAAGAPPVPGADAGDTIPPVQFAGVGDPPIGPAIGNPGGDGGAPPAGGPGLPSLTSAVPPISTPPISTGAVPEPSTWAMMILGFGIVGAAIRRARARVGLGSRVSPPISPA